jgi:hypothetical protein
MSIRNWRWVAKTPALVAGWPWCTPGAGVPLKQQVGGKILHGRKSNKHVGPISCAYCPVQFGTKSRQTRRFSFIYPRKGRLRIAFTAFTRREHLHAHAHQVGFNHVDCQLLIQLGFITVL